MMKSNYDFLYYKTSDGKYAVNSDVILAVLQDIRRGRRETTATPGRLYDCGKIPGLDRIVIETRKQEIDRTKIKPIVDVVNKNVNTLGGYQLYLLFIKFKVLSAITSNDFLTALIGEEAGVAVANQAKAEKKEAARLAAAEAAAEKQRKTVYAAREIAERHQRVAAAAALRSGRSSRSSSASRTTGGMKGGVEMYVESGLYIDENMRTVDGFIDNLKQEAFNNAVSEFNRVSAVGYEPVQTDPGYISVDDTPAGWMFPNDEPDGWEFPQTFLDYIQERLPADKKLTNPTDPNILKMLPYVLFHWDKSPAENVQDIDDAVNSIIEIERTVLQSKKLKELEESIVAAETAALRILEAKALGKIPIQGVSYRPTAQLGKTNPFSNIRKGTQIPKERNTGTMRRNRLRLTPLVSAKYRGVQQIIQQPRSVRSGRRTRKLKKRL
jgi:hypothetical protein